jgi:glycerol uptake facilitator-like aquaporin
MSTSKLARLFAELLGTFALTAVVIAVSKNYGNPLFTTISAATAFAGLYCIFGSVSGGHFNPAITLGLFSVKKVKLLEALMFVAMQAVGAVLAWKFFEYLSPERAIEAVGNEFTWEIFWAEMVGGLLLALGFAAVVYRKFVGGHAGAVVGMSLFLASTAVAVVIFDRQLVSGVLNPAVAIGLGYRPDVQVYLAYFFGPVVGAVIGMNLYKMFFSGDKTEVAASASKPAPVAVSATAKKAPAKKKAVAKKAAPKRKTTKK